MYQQGKYPFKQVSKFEIKEYLSKFGFSGQTKFHHFEVNIKYKNFKRASNAYQNLPLWDPLY